MGTQDNSNQTPFGANDLGTNPIGTAGNALAGLLSSIGGALQQAYPASSNPNGTNMGGVAVQQGSPQNPVSSQQLMSSIMPNISQQQNTTNPLTGLDDNAAQILQKVINKHLNDHAETTVSTIGPQKAQQAVNLHTATSPSNNVAPSQNSNQPNQNSGNINNDAISNFLNTNTKSPETVPVSNPAGPSSQKTGNFEYDRPQNLFEQLVGRPQVYQDSSGAVHYKPGGLFGSSANQEALNQAKDLLGLSSKEPLQPKDLMELGMKKAAVAFDINDNANQAAKTYRNEYQKMSDDSGWTDTVKNTQLAMGIDSKTNNPMKQQQLVEAATGEKLGDLLKDPDAMAGLKGNLGNQAEGIINKLSQGKSALTSQQMDRLKDVVNQQYQSKKVQFALASKGMADQISSDNKRRIGGAQIDPSTVLRPMDVVSNQQNKASAKYNVPDGRVVVKNKDGQIGHIPQNQLKDALSSGYTQVQ